MLLRHTGCDIAFSPVLSSRRLRPFGETELLVRPPAASGVLLVTARAFAPWPAWLLIVLVVHERPVLAAGLVAAAMRSFALRRVGSESIVPAITTTSIAGALEAVGPWVATAPPTRGAAVWLAVAATHELARLAARSRPRRERDNGAGARGRGASDLVAHFTAPILGVGAGMAASHWALHAAAGLILVTLLGACARSAPAPTRRWGLGGALALGAAAVATLALTVGSVADGARTHAIAAADYLTGPDSPARVLELAFPLAAFVTGLGASSGLLVRAFRAAPLPRVTLAARSAGWLLGANLALLAATSLVATDGSDSVDGCPGGGTPPEGMDC